MEYGIAAPKYRLPAATQLGRVKLQVSDLERSLAFYQDVLGFRIIERSSDGATLGAQGSVAPLIELLERKGARRVPRRGLLGLFHFAILLPDRPALGRFLRHLAELGVQPGMSDHFVSEAIYLQDPDNLGIEVYADRPRSTWRQEEGQIHIGTVPLNVESVLEAGGDEPWTGAPEGTTLGHVHLHVGDLDQAEAFYHEALGFDKTAWSYPGALFLSAGGYHHHLGTNTWARGAPSTSAEDARLVEWEIVVPARKDVDETGASLRSAGYSIDVDGDSVVARDPWGTQFRIMTGGR
jgi:catechol 2,3-dioxygenase